MLSPGDSLKEISYEVYSGMTTDLKACFNSLGPGKSLQPGRTLCGGLWKGRTLWGGLWKGYLSLFISI